MEQQEKQQKPICNVEAESALVGGLMMDNSQIERAASIVNPDDFYDDLHRQIFKTICHLRKTGDEANPVTMQPYFSDYGPVEYRDINDGRLKSMPVIELLINLMAPLTVISVVSAAEQIRMLATMRRAAAIAADGVEALRGLSIEDDEDAESVIGGMASDLLTQIEQISEVKVQRASRVIGRVRERMTRSMEEGGAACTCRHLPELTDLIGPMEGGQMTILAGRPGMGKSVIAQGIAWGTAANGKATIFISEELSEEMLGMRLAADITHAMGEPVSFTDIIRNRLGHSDLLSIDAAAEKVDQIPLYMVAPRNRSIDELEARVAQVAAALKRKGMTLSLIVVDYLQLVTVNSKRHMDQRELTNFVSGRLIDIAKRYNAHMLALSQLTRAVDQREDRRPKLSDLKESGKLEEDASNVLFAYREEYYLSRNLPKKGDVVAHEEWRADLEKAHGVLDLICAKSRSADVGDKELRFIGNAQAVRSINWKPVEMGEMSDLI